MIKYISFYGPFDINKINHRYTCCNISLIKIINIIERTLVCRISSVAVCRIITKTHKQRAHMFCHANPLIYHFCVPSEIFKNLRRVI